MFRTLLNNIKHYHLQGLVVFVLILSFTIFGTWSFLLGSLILISMTRSLSIRVDVLFIVIFVLLVMYIFQAGISGSEAVTKSLYIALSSIALYLISKSYAMINSDDYPLLFFLFLMGLSIAIPDFIITIKDIIDFGLINPTRQLVQLSNEDGARNVTQRVVQMSLCIGMSGMIFNKKTPDSLRYIIFLCFIFSIIGLLCSIHFVSRTGLLLFILSLAVGYLINNGISFKIITFLMITVVLYYLVSSIEIFEIYAEREIDGSSFAEAGGRTTKWSEGFELILQYPFGSPSNTWLDFYAHNLWLDFGKVTGIIPFAFLVCLSLINAYQVCKIFYANKYSRVIKLAIVLTFVSFLSSNFTEPIHQGIPNYFIMYFGFIGFTYGLYKRIKYANSGNYR